MAIAVPTAAAQNAQNDALATSDIVEALTRRISDFYVLPDSADRINAAINARFHAGAYDSLRTRAELARALTYDLRDISDDAHFGVLYDTTLFSGVAPMLAELNGPGSREYMRSILGGQVENGPEMPAAQVEIDRRQNYYLTAAEVLPGNVGFLKLDRMPELQSAKATVDAAMAFLSNTDAFILDVRGNPGGVGGFIPYLMSYFLPADSIALYSRAYDGVGITEVFSTYRTLPGRRLDSVPLFVLMDQRSGSAARNLAYTLQNLGRALLVGAATGETGNRGAHSAGVLPLADGLVALVPIGRVINARTGSNWRDTGVQPDIQTNPDDAKSVAHRRALEALTEQVDDPAAAAELQRALAALDALDAVDADDAIVDNAEGRSADEADRLNEFVGQYGVRTITQVDGSLHYRREGMQTTLEMKEEAPDTFRLILPANARSAGPIPTIVFERGADGSVTGFRMEDSEGNVMETVPKDT